jgi:hypothetical protein
MSPDVMGSCATKETECGVNDADLTDLTDLEGTCPEHGKTTDKPTKSMTFTVGTCMTAAYDPDELMGAASIAPAASWKIVCSGGKGVVKLFTDSACAIAIASATVIDTNYNAMKNPTAGPGMHRAGSARRRSHSCAPLPQRFYL